MASTYDKASLVLIPSGTKEGTIFSQKPTNGDGDFTFSRSTSATRVGPSGYIEKETQNLLLQSNQFDTTWVSLNTTETGGQSGYDGSSDAWLITKSASSARVYQTISVSGVQTYSVYAKSGTLNWVAVSNNLCYTYFNLSAGTIGTNVGTIDANIEDVGSGWYRCSITYNGSATDARIYPSQGDNDSSGTSGNIYIQDAQLEQGLVARDYIETTTSAVYGGITDNIPRLDYNGSCPSLLLEGQRTNLITHSEYFGSGSGWLYLNNVSVGNFVLSPEGKMNATELVFDGTTSGRLERNLIGLSAGADYSVSLYARVASGTQNVFFGSTTAGVFTLTTEWQRLERTEPENDTNAYPRIVCDDVATIEIWGFQLEQGSYATSYIPTYGSAVTRNVDFESDNDLVDTAISFGANDDFTLFYEGSFNDLNSSANMIMGGGKSSIGTSYKNYWWLNNTVSMRITGDAEVRLASASMSLSNNTNHKLLVRRSGSVVDFFVDGSKLTTTQSTPNTAFTFRSLGWSYANSAYKVSGNIKQALVFNQALTDEEAIALTTI